MVNKPLTLSLATLLVGCSWAMGQYGDTPDPRGPAWFEGPPRPLIGGSGNGFKQNSNDYYSQQYAQNYSQNQTQSNAQVRWDGPPTPIFGGNKGMQRPQRQGYNLPREIPNGSTAYPETQAFAMPQSYPGAVETPWCGDMRAGANCSGPVGRNGPITHEVYLRTGPSILVSSDGFAGHLQSGWVIGGGGRTLFFNQARSAAWVMDLGISFTRNDGVQLQNIMFVQASLLKGGNPADNSLLAVGVRGVNRTSFNFGIGRDWWLNGPGTVGENTFGNWLFGTDVGGRYGTSSVSFEPLNEVGGARRRQSVFHGYYFGTQLNFEFPIYTWISVIGARAEYSHSFGNLIPPNGGDIKDVNILLLLGIRF